MSSKPKKVRIPSQVEIFKGIRKEPIPPGRTFQPRNRSMDDEFDEHEIERWRGWRGEPLEEFESEVDESVRLYYEEE